MKVSGGFTFYKEPLSIWIDIKMVDDSKKQKLLAELAELEKKIEVLRNENEDLKAIIEQILIDNMGLKSEVKHMLEESQAMRGIGIE